MTSTLTFDSRQVQGPWPPLLAQQLNHWHSLTTIVAAEVVLQHRGGNGQAFRVKVRLEVTGAGLDAEACDATLEGALLLVTRDVEGQIQARQTKSLGKGEGPAQPGALSRPGGRVIPHGRKVGKWGC